MRILVDTNILLDAMIGREPFYQNADTILHLCASKKIEGYIAAHSIPNMFYILRKNYSEEDRRAILLGLCQILRVEGIDTEKICSALQNSAFSDFEDCLQAECAMQHKWITSFQEIQMILN